MISLGCVVNTNSDKWAKLRHAEAHDCNHKTVEVLERPYSTVVVTEGCGGRDAEFSHVVSGVSWHNRVSTLLQRVRFEQKCEEFEWSVVSDTAVGVDACGSRSVYVSTIDGWVLNSDIEEAS